MGKKRKEGGGGFNHIHTLCHREKKKGEGVIIHDHEQERLQHTIALESHGASYCTSAKNMYTAELKALSYKALQIVQRHDQKKSEEGTTATGQYKHRI
jgi:hypothetical protein